MKKIKKKFDLLITSEQSDYKDPKETVIPLAELPDYEEEGETCEFFTEAELVLSSDGQFSLSYDESELTGMEGSVTSVNFNVGEPTLVSLLRSGAYRMAMVFEQGKRHICTYQTPYMPIELAVTTRKLENTLTENGGHLYAEYTIDAGGMRCERAKIRLEARESK